MHLDLVNLLAVLLAAWTAGKVAARVGYPAVLGELLAGILLGPPILGLIETGPALEVLAQVGVLLMMLYIGMEIDPRELKKASWGGLLAAVGGFITPFVLCFGLVVGLGGTALAATFVGIAAGVTSLATKSRILVDLDIMDTRIAHVMMAGALVADTFSLVAFAAILGTAGETGGDLSNIDAAALGLIALKALIFFAVAGVLGLVALPRLGRLLVKHGLATRTASFTLVLAIAVAFAELAELAGLHGVVGAFVAGLFMRDQALGRQLTAELRHVVHDASIGFLAPIFFVTAGFAVSFETLQQDALTLLGLIFLATAGKIIGTALFYLPTGNGWREGLTIGAGMNGRGAVEIILAGIALEAGIIDARLFSMLVFLAIATTATVPVLLGWGVKWLRSRDELVSAKEARSGVVIVGASKTGRVLARILSEAHPVWLIDTNHDNCEAALEEGLDALHADALESGRLEEAGAHEAAIFISLTRNAQVNTLTALMARQVFHIPEVFVLQLDEGVGHDAALRHVDAQPLFGKVMSLREWDAHLLEAETALDRDPDTEERFRAAVERSDELEFHPGADLHAEDVLLMLRGAKSGGDGGEQDSAA